MVRLYCLFLLCATASALQSAKRMPLRRRLAPVAALPPVAAACTMPTCLGFWKSGYAVSYGYGGAMAAAGVLGLRASSGAVGAAHAAALIFYGVRLNLFLLWRELSLPASVHQMKRRPASLAQRLKRAPLILGCSFLYYCMAAPLRLTAHSAAAPTSAVGAAVALAYVGFAVAAVGDAYKSWVKHRQGADTLVTGGPFAYLRHPNYTGEMLGWSASACAAFLAASGALRANAAWLATSAVGLAGIVTVLAGEATAGLERKQKLKYGSDPAYKAWVARTWAGPMFAAPEPPPVDNKFERVAWSGTCYPKRA